MAIDLASRRRRRELRRSVLPGPAADTPSASSGARTPFLSEGRVYALLMLAPLAVMAVLFAYPFAALVVKSFSSPSGPFGHYIDLLGDETFQIALWNTFLYALITAASTALLGYPIALLLASVRASFANILLLLVLVPFWTSVVVRCYAWIVLLGRHGVFNESLSRIGLLDAPLQLVFNGVGVIIGMVHVMLPYMVLSIFSAMARLNKEILAAADSLGATRMQAFFRVLLPLTMPGVLGGFTLVFVMSLGFFITPALLGGPRNLVAAMVIRDQVTKELAWDDAAAASVILLVLTCGTFLVAARVFGLKRHMSHLWR
jgi:ABC-type spermidine/putrescine transport system permease subunit I